jgi:hypothetical protein
MADEPNFMDRRGGYTKDPRAALAGVPIDEDALCGPLPGSERARQFAQLEPEPVPPEEVADLPSSRANREQFDAFRDTELRHRAAKSRSTRLRNLQSEAIRLGIDVDRMLKAIDRQLDLVGRTVAQAKRAA